MAGLETKLDDQKEQVDRLTSKNQSLEAKVKSTSMFKQLLKSLKNQLEQ